MRKTTKIHWRHQALLLAKEVFGHDSPEDLVATAKCFERFLFGPVRVSNSDASANKAPSHKARAKGHARHVGA